MMYVVLGLGLIVAVATHVADALLTVRRDAQAGRRRQAEERQRAKSERELPGD